MITSHLKVCCFLGGLGLALALAPPANAVPIANLDSLIGTGTTGVVLDGLRFHSFAYSVVSTDPIAPSAADIVVSDRTSLQPTPPPGVSVVGLGFSYGWAAMDGDSIVSTISYRVTAVDPAATFISGIGLTFNGVAAPAGTGTFAQVQETAALPPPSGLTVATLTVLNDGSGPAVDNNTASAAIAPLQTDLLVTKVISVHSGFINDGGGVATISIVENATFTVVPEPQVLLAAASAFLLLRSRTQRS